MNSPFLEALFGYVKDVGAFSLGAIILALMVEQFPLLGALLVALLVAAAALDARRKKS